jgi:hypothetical protein
LAKSKVPRWAQTDGLLRADLFGKVQSPRWAQTDGLLRADLFGNDVSFLCYTYVTEEDRSAIGIPGSKILVVYKMKMSKTGTIFANARTTKSKEENCWSS